MPTGYTADVSSGKITDFSDFAMQCARAFGALITMRDEPHSTPIPEEFAPDNYYRNSLVEAQSDLAELDAMDSDAIHAGAAKANDVALQSYRDYLKEKTEIRNRYETMLSKVAGWTPPSSDHQELKVFMINQLRESIRCDCNYALGEPQLYTATEWLNNRREYLRRNITHRTEALAKECERAATRTAWVKALRTSLMESVQ